MHTSGRTQLLLIPWHAASTLFVNIHRRHCQVGVISSQHQRRFSTYDPLRVPTHNSFEHLCQDYDGLGNALATPGSFS